MYLLRLDDASEYMDVDKWSKIESILDKYKIKPIVGVIPNNADPTIVRQYGKSVDFWAGVKNWENKGWTIALHGYNHVYTTNDAGINPVNSRSEFAGVDLEQQRIKIRNGIEIFKEHELFPKIFFAPAHTFDENTLSALKTESEIRVISDTIANDVYKINDFYYIPQQSGNVRVLPFKVSTFCYHPNSMKEKDFIRLEQFLGLYQDKFVSFDYVKLIDRRKGLYDKLLSWAYFSWKTSGMKTWMQYLEKTLVHIRRKC